MPPTFGSTKHKEVSRLSQRLIKAKTSDDRKRFQGQIDYLMGEITKEEKEAEDYFDKM